MCAIIGAVGAIPPREQIEHARDRMTHRGPNDAGLYYEPKEGVALGHRRLSIIDLTEAGHQPLVSNDGRFVIIYNGEVYNYIELKEELKGTYEFKTETDTEVLLAAYILWGEKCLKRLNGMFSFAIWDKEKKTLFCARDHLGIKPFFYTEHNGAFLFSSEIKGLLAFGVPKIKNERIIFEYLRHGLYDHRDETFFQGIKRLPAGHSLTWKDNKIKIAKYWDLSHVKQNHSISFDEAKEKLRELLSDAIRIQFRSDVPVGVNLSSGLDSNSLYHYANEVTGGKAEAFTICMESEEYNECTLLEEVLAPNEKKRWHQTFASPRGVWGNIERMNVIQGEPFGGIPTVAYESVHEKARQDGVVVLLEGQGGDELFAGYKYYLLDHEKDGGKKTDRGSIMFSQDMTTPGYPSVLARNFISKHVEFEFLDSFKAPFESHLLNAQYRDLVYTKLPRVLRMNDHASMAHARELRVPLLDYRIVEFCFSLPAEYKIHDGVQKYILREAMKDIVPQKILQKQKKAFGAVQSEWFRNYLKEDIYALVSSKTFQSRPYWDHEALREKIDRFFAGEGDNSFFLWQCVNLELWFREFIDPSTP